LVTVSFELGALVCVDGIFDDQSMESEFGCDRIDFLDPRTVQTYPRHPAMLAHCLTGAVEAVRGECSFAVDVNGIVDDRQRAALSLEVSPASKKPARSRWEASE
jgi:hypothetical protein